MRRISPFTCGVAALVALSAGLFSADARAALILEMRRLVDPVPFGRYVYLCSTCTEAQFSSIVPPAGWEKAEVKLFMPSEGVRPATLPTTEGQPLSVDFIPEIPGDEFKLIAQVVGAAVIGFGPQGPWARAQVERDTLFRYDAGSLIHEVTEDATGDTFALFGLATGIIGGLVDPTVPGGLSGLVFPPGWTYSSRVLPADLFVESTSIAEVFATGSLSSWQLVVPEPTSVLLLATGLALLARRRRRS